MCPKVVIPTVEETLALQAARIRHLESLEHGIEPFTAHLNNPCARVYHNANQNIPSGVPTPLAFNSERFDTDGIHDTVINNTRLTCRTAGKYQISAVALWAASAAGRRVIRFMLNGITLIASIDMNPGLGGDTQSISTLWDLAVNDYVECEAFQTSGGPLNIVYYAATSPEFMMARVG